MTSERQQTEADLSADAMHQIRGAMSDAVRSGIRDALTDREVLGLFWAAAFDQMQQRATKETGKFVLGGLRTMAARGFWFLLLGLVTYQAGGWSALLAAWKAMTATGGHG